MASSARGRFLALIALIAVLLPALALLQYRWLGELSGLEQLRALTNLKAATARFSTEFDAKLASVYGRFYAAAEDAGSPASPALLGATRELASAGFVKGLYVIDSMPGARLTAKHIDADGRETAVAALPDWLGTPADVDEADDDRLPPGLLRTLLDEVPAMVVHRPLDARDRWIVLELDLERIVHTVLPDMLAGCFEGGIPVTYDVLVIGDDLPNRVVYRSRDGLERASFDASNTPMPVFAIHGRDLDRRAALTLRPDAGAHRWRMLIQPQSGALEAAVGAARARNLAIGIGVLALLAVSVGLLVFSMHRVQRAQREQLELVARISHELRTPLATITCAGENLADNLVETPEEARQYGQLIRREGRRLTKTIGDILLSCRLQAKTDTVLNLQPLDIQALIGLAVADTQLVAAEHGVRIDTLIETPLPPVLADKEALKMAIKNLLVNAVKYGNRHPVRVSAKSRRAGAAFDVLITVEDQGPGIPSDELPQIFEPFFRGRVARGLEIEGSGIGLSIVQQVVRLHGGRIRVSSGERGTKFTLQLRALPAGSSVPANPAA